MCCFVSRSVSLGSLGGTEAQAASGPARPSHGLGALVERSAPSLCSGRSAGRSGLC